MAAIIAQMTRANRERKKNKCFEIVIGKCMYEIGPFPEKYEPEVCYIDSKSITVLKRKDILSIFANYNLYSLHVSFEVYCG